MNMKHFLALCTCSFPAINIHAGNFFVAPELSRAILSIDEDYTASRPPEEISEAALAAGVFAGYTLDSKFSFGATMHNYTESSVFFFRLGRQLSSR